MVLAGGLLAPFDPSMFKEKHLSAKQQREFSQPFRHLDLLLAQALNFIFIYMYASLMIDDAMDLLLALARVFYVPLLTYTRTPSHSPSSSPTPYTHHHQLAAACPLDVMPGADDPANYTLPQQPLHPCLLPHTYVRSRVAFVLYMRGTGEGDGGGPAYTYTPKNIHT